MGETKRDHIFIIIWGTLEILFGAGLIFGWGSLVFVFKQEGYFASLCGVATSGRRETGLAEDGVSSVGLYGDFLNLSLLVPNISSNVNSTNKYQPVLLPAYGNEARLDRASNQTWPGGVSNCPLQDRHFNLIYTLATVITGVTNFANGWLLDRFGIRLCRCIGIITYVTAIVLAAVSTPSTPLLLYPSMVMLTFGGYNFLMSNLQLGNLIPHKKSTVISLYCGAYDSSSFVLVLFKFAYEGGISLRTCFICQAIIFSICIISTFWYLPKTRIPFPLPDNYEISLTCSCEPKGSKCSDPTRDKSQMNNIAKEMKEAEAEAADKSEMKLLSGTEQEENQEVPKTEVVSFRSLLFSPLFLWDLVWLTCHRFASWSFVGRLNPTLDRLADGNTSIVGRYTSIYASLQFFGIFLAPISGRLMDRRPKHSPETPKNDKLDKLEVCIASFMWDSTIGTLLAITLSIPLLEVQYVTFILHVIHRACLYGPNSAFIAQAFPMEHFGKLYGLAMSIAAAFSLIQFPIFVLIQGPLQGNPLWSNMFTLCLMLISYGHPIYIHWWCRRERRKDLWRASQIYKPQKAIQL